MNKVAANSVVSDLRHFYEVTTQSSKDTFRKIDTLLTRSNLEHSYSTLEKKSFINQQQSLSKYGGYNLLLNTSWIALTE